MAIEKNSSIPLQRQLKSEITSQIESGLLKPGSRIPSERELSDIYGVSRATSKGAVMALLNEGIVTRIPGKGTYIRTDVSVSAGKSTRCATVAFVLCHAKPTRFAIERDPVFFSVLEGIHEYSQKMNNHVLFQYVDEDSLDEMDSFRSLMSKVDGVILGAAESDVFTRILEQERMPHVLAFPLGDFDGKVVINFDHANAGKRSITYLIDRGHTEIGLLGGPTNDRAANLRHQGAKDSFGSRGTRIRDSFVCRSEGWHIPDGYRAALELLDGKELPTAIFCASDLLAVGALRACSEKNLRVPEDVSILGCDDTALAENSMPRLTSVDTHKAVLGRLAAQYLFALIDDADFPPVTTTMPVRVVERESVRDIHTLAV